MLPRDQHVGYEKMREENDMSELQYYSRFTGGLIHTQYLEKEVGVRSDMLSLLLESSPLLMRS